MNESVIMINIILGGFLILAFIIAYLFCREENPKVTSESEPEPTSYNVKKITATIDFGSFSIEKTFTGHFVGECDMPTFVISSQTVYEMWLEKIKARGFIRFNNKDYPVSSIKLISLVEEDYIISERPKS